MADDNEATPKGEDGKPTERRHVADADLRVDVKTDTKIGRETVPGGGGSNEKDPDQNEDG